MKKYQDHYFKKAKQDNYPARSVYKLKELDAKFKLLRPGQKVLDLGAAPGSWTLYAAERVGPSGKVLAADLQATSQGFPGNVTFRRENVFERTPEFEAELADWRPFDLVISDMAPSTTGHRGTDQARSMALAEEALALASVSLVKGGHFVVKIFQGPDEQAYLMQLRGLFDQAKGFKPKSSRSESKEMFCVGLGFKGIPEAGGLPPETAL